MKSIVVNGKHNVTEIDNNNIDMPIEQVQAAMGLKQIETLSSALNEGAKYWVRKLVLPTHKKPND